MAYADKVTTMRRMAIIYKNHNIVWEGVNIEGTCLLRKVDDGIQVMVIEEDELKGFIENENLCTSGDKLEIKYQDLKTDDYWEPRKT